MLFDLRDFDKTSTILASCDLLSTSLIVIERFNSLEFHPTSVRALYLQVGTLLKQVIPDVIDLAIGLDSSTTSRAFSSLEILHDKHLIF